MPTKTIDGDSSGRVGMAIGEPVGDALRRIGDAQFARVAEGLRGFPNRDTGIHEARKALKRIRALLRLARPHLDTGVFRADYAVLRDVGRALAPMRDARVTIDTLDAIAPGTCPALRAALVERHGTALAELTDSSVLGELAEAMDRAAARWGVLFPAAVPGGFEAIGPGISLAYRRGRKRLHRALGRRRDEDFHEWRKEVKRLRYQIETVRSLDPEVLTPLIVLLDVLGESLGAGHDLTVLKDLVEDEPGCGEDRAWLVSALRDLRAGLRASAVTLGGIAYSPKPSAVAESLREIWDSAHRTVG